MSNTSSSSSSGGIGFVGVLTILFIALKLTGYIDWSWWWVLSPIWIGAIFTVILLIGLAVFMFRQEIADKRARLKYQNRHIR